MTDNEPLQTGAVLSERYRIESRIGSGGYSEVLAARDLKHDRRVALKVLLAEATEHDPDAVARMRQEAEILRAISHPNIVRIHEVDHFDRGQFLVMEYVDGVGLDELFEDGEAFETKRLLPLVRQLLDALDAAHGTQILHRDLKPANILVTGSEGDESIKLLDFGVAKAGALLNTDDPDEGITLVKTRSDNFVGTPRYSAPEMVVGDPPSPATDLFCVGLIVYEALMGSPLIKGQSRSALMSQLVFPRPFDLDGVPDAWIAWLTKMLEKSPERRIESAAEARAALDELFGSDDSAKSSPSRSPENAPQDSEPNTDAASASSGNDDEFEEDENTYPAFGESPPLLASERSPDDEGALAPLVAGDVPAHDAPTIERPPPQMPEDAPTIERPPPQMPEAENPFAEEDAELNVWHPDTRERATLKKIQQSGKNTLQKTGETSNHSAARPNPRSQEQVDPNSSPADGPRSLLAMAGVVAAIVLLILTIVALVILIG